jgi:hypothetical protein
MHRYMWIVSEKDTSFVSSLQSLHRKLQGDSSFHLTQPPAQRREVILTALIDCEADKNHVEGNRDNNDDLVD